MLWSDGCYGVMVAMTSVFEDAEVSRDDFVFEDTARRDVNAISVVGDDDHCALGGGC